jgi:diguanylate cyclase (GGDEF)-like protein
MSFSPTTATSSQFIEIVTELLTTIEQQSQAIQELLEESHQALRRNCAMTLKDSASPLIIQLVTTLITLSKKTIESVSHKRKQLQEAFQNVRYLREALAKSGSIEQMDMEPLLADPLTGAYHRRALPRLLEELKKQDHTTSKPLVILVSLDHLEKIQTEFDVETTHSALRHLSQHIRMTLPDTDPIIRYTDTTFLILTHNDISGARHQMERVKDQLKRIPVILQEQNKTLYIHFSGGVAPLDLEKPTEESIQQAHSALQAAQQAGGNNLKVMALSSGGSTEK